jgi:hypothetical protein
MGQPTEFADLTNVSFEDFVRFLFDRRVDPKPRPPKKWNPWYWHVSVKFDAQIVCDYYVKLFQQPGFLLTRFTKDQLEEGFWAIQGPNLDCSAYRIIHESDLPLSSREECIRSMSHLFKRLFVAEPLDTAVQMWWDSFCYDWHCGIRRRERGGEDSELQDVFFETLSRILAIDSEGCQGAALHGLGHLHHPNTQALVDQFIREHAEISEPMKKYALAAARFEVM